MIEDWSAVTGYQASGNREDSIGDWSHLLEESPQSEWAKRAGHTRQ